MGIAQAVFYPFDAPLYGSISSKLKTHLKSTKGPPVKGVIMYNIFINRRDKRMLIGNKNIIHYNK